MSDADDEALFLMDPHIEKNPPARFGILYLLRCDIFRCMGVNPNTGKPGSDASPSPVWPGAMAIMAGIDLLAKFLTGNDRNNVGERFRKFLEQCFKLTSPSDRETIYQLRNSLLHSFGLYSEDNNGNIYRFSLNQDGPLIQPPANPSDPMDRCVVNIRKLHEEFERAVSEYRTMLQTGPQAQILRRHFAQMFPKYGSIDIGHWISPAMVSAQLPQTSKQQGPSLIASEPVLNLSSTYPK